jgi:spore coat protein CotH
LLAEDGLDCGACVDPSFIEEHISDDTACEWNGMADDLEAERNALKPGKLWDETSFLFEDDAKVWPIEFVLTKARWHSLLDDPVAEEYVEGAIKIDGLGEWWGVGIRFKGYVGSLRICLIDYPANLGAIECAKLSYKIRFNYKDPEQRFFGLKKLQFHAGLQDTTFMRERLSYSLYREMGVPAPRQALSTLRVRFEGDDCATEAGFLGLHLLTEVIDGRFTKAYFDNGGGDDGDGQLYKEGEETKRDPILWLNYSCWLYV